MIGLTRVQTLRRVRHTCRLSRAALGDARADTPVVRAVRGAKGKNPAAARPAAAAQGAESGRSFDRALVSPVLVGTDPTTELPPR